MSTGDDVVSRSITCLAGEAAPETVRALAATLERPNWDSPTQARSTLLSTTVLAHLRALAGDLLDAWQPAQDTLSAAALATALRAAAATATRCERPNAWRCFGRDCWQRG